MGKRKDNNRWTFPGGHLDEGETPHEGALRELYEESGIEAHQLSYLSQHDLKTPDIKVHCFRFGADHKTTVKNDPDDEVYGWQWVKYEGGLPEEIRNNLHVPEERNVMLSHLVEKSNVYYIDLKKGMAAAGHKYLRKYKGRDGKWVYVYKEKGQPAVRIPEEKINRMKAIVEELGERHEQVKPIAQLLGTLKEFDTAPMKKLHLLINETSGNDEHAHIRSNAKKHLRDKYGIDDHEELSHMVAKDDIDKPFVVNDDVNKAFEAKFALETVLDNNFNHLSNYQNNPLYENLKSAGITADSIMSGINEANTLRELINAFNDGLKKIETAHEGLRSRRHQDGYARGMYAEGIRNLEEAGFLPRGYAQAVPYGEQPIEIEGVKKAIKEREERERRAEEERVRREQAEIAEYIPLADEAMEYFGIRGDGTRLKVAKGIKSFFGKDFSMSYFNSVLNPDPDAKHIIRVNDNFIHDLMGGRSSISFSFIIKSKGGEKITTASRTIRKNGDGSISWYNGHFVRPSNTKLKRYSGLSKGVYKGVESFLLKVTENYEGNAKSNSEIHMSAANSGFTDGYKGAILWAKHKFAFQDDHDRARWRRGIREQLESYKSKFPDKVSMIDSAIGRLESLKEPHEFINLGIAMNKEEAESIAGGNLDFDYTEIYKVKDYVDIGELALVKSRMNFNGISYFNQESGVHGELNQLRAAYYRRNSNNVSSASDDLINRWKSGSGNIVITQKRLEQIARMRKSDATDFMNKAPLTRAAKKRVKEIIDRIGG
jgi:hypothetical protein